MIATDLIKRQRGRYYLTPFGKVIYCCIMIAKNALNNYYKLKAISLDVISALLYFSSVSAFVFSKAF